MNTYEDGLSVGIGFAMACAIKVTCYPRILCEMSLNTYKGYPVIITMLEKMSVVRIPFFIPLRCLIAASWGLGRTTGKGSTARSTRSRSGSCPQ